MIRPWHSVPAVLDARHIDADGGTAHTETTKASNGVKVIRLHAAADDEALSKQR